MVKMKTYNISVSDVALLGAIDKMAETYVSTVLCGTDGIWYYAKAKDGERFLIDSQNRVCASDRPGAKSCRGVVDGQHLTLYANDETILDRLPVTRAFEIPAEDITRMIDDTPQPPARPVRKRAA